MAAEVTMPKMGYDMEEGTILQWLKAEGDDVAKGDILGEIETGKVNIEIEAFDEGVLRKILVDEGQTVPVGTAIALIGAADEEIDLAAYAGGGAGAASSANGAAAVEGVTAPAAAAVAEAMDDGERLRASPLARRIAAEHGVALDAIAGTGPHGRIVRDDVMAAIEAGTADSATAATAAAAAPVAAAVATAPARPVAVTAEDTRETLSGMRRTIAKRLSESWVSAPHIFLTMPVEMDAALALRKQINTALEATDGGKISVNDLIVKACGKALAAHPRINVSWDDGERIQRGRVNVGVAVALEDGLITLTVPDADQRSIAAIGAEIVDKATRAREGKLTPEDLGTPSTFTVSNLGMYGIEEFTAIINPPEACILAVGGAKAEAVVRDGEIVVRSVMRLTLSADHRVVDGASAAEFLVTLRDLLEQPLAMLV
jgi:pyruvate dehydrogenase E2 component (dihydrolipoamide acetyltransferase)